MAEMLRITGQLLLLQGGPGAAAAAEDHFRQALDWAHRQGAVSWELRAATSVARLLRDQGCPADALRSPVLGARLFRSLVLADRRQGGLRFRRSALHVLALPR